MEEIFIKTKIFNGLAEIIAQIIDGKIVLITDDNRSQKEKYADIEYDFEDDFYADNDDWIFSFYKVLKEVDKRGGFDHLKSEEESKEIKNSKDIWV